jgi:hypothetical protein
MTLVRPTSAPNAEKQSTSNMENKMEMTETLELIVNRDFYTPKNTIGILSIGNSRWYTLEDAVRKIKILKETAIPSGRYRIIPYVYSSLSQIRPMFLNVPNYEGIFMHPGNTEADTAGCLLVGKNQSMGVLMESRKAYSEICVHLCNAWTNKKEVWITIIDKENHPWFDPVEA